MDDKTGWEIVGIIAKYYGRLLSESLRKSPFYGIMVDETTDRSTSIKLIIYLKYLEENKDGIWSQKIEYLDLVTPTNQTALSLKVLY